MTRRNGRTYGIFIALALLIAGGVYLLLQRDSGIISPVPDDNGIKVLYISPKNDQ